MKAARTGKAKGAEEHGGAPARSAAWFWPVLAGILAAALAARIAILVEYTTRNPLSDLPINDAQTYWEWAGRIAGGQVFPHTPFFSAPLYPWLLGMFRALGAGLDVVYVLQILMDLGSATLLALAARRRFGPATGLLSAGLFLLLLEPASFSLRILTCSLQLLLVAWTYGQLLRVQERPTLWRNLHAGLALGLLCLAHAPAMALVVGVVIWRIWEASRAPVRLARALLPGAVAALLIAPVTIHNYRASGDLFFIQAVSAVNLRQGNQPESIGIYTPIPNTTIGREKLFEAVARQYELATGRRGSWGEVNRYYAGLVRAFWREDPARAVRLAARKAYYFLTSRNYGDIYQPKAEMAAGVADWLGRLAPLPLPWLVGPALVGLVLLARRPVRHLPELLMFAIPFLLVSVYWFTPRYRLPALPIIVVVAAWMLRRLADWRRERAVALATVTAVAASIAVGYVNRAAGFRDDYIPAGVAYHMGLALREQGKLAEAAEKFEFGLSLRPDDPLGRTDYADILAAVGRLDDARAQYQRAHELAPGHPDIAGKLGQLLLSQRRYAEADAVLTRGVAANPNHPMLLKVAAVAKYQLGDLGQAAALLGQALQYMPRDTQTRLERAGLLVQLRRIDEARAELDEVLRLDPGNGPARQLRAQLGSPPLTP